MSDKILANFAAMVYELHTTAVLIDLPQNYDKDLSPVCTLWRREQ